MILTVNPDTNGFHDSANAMATSMATRSTPAPGAR